MNTFLAAAAAGLAWLLVEWKRDGHATNLGAASGIVAGLVAITPAAGYVSGMGPVWIGLIAGGVCCYAVKLKTRFGFDDALDVVGVHFVGGLVGSLLIGFFANPDFFAGTFREGILYGGSVRLLAEHFIEELNRRSPRRIERISAGAAAALAQHDWPGNVRELRNAIEYAFVSGEGTELEIADLPPELGGAPSVTAPRYAERVVSGRTAGPPEGDEESQIRQALRQAGGHAGAAAALLRISRVTLWRRMKQLGLGKSSRRKR
jgi:hypothetical protein